MQKLIFTLLLASLSLIGYTQPSADFAANTNSQNEGMKWAQKNPFDQKVFIENKGQFDLGENTVKPSDILFGADIGHQFYFTKSGFVCRMSKMESMTEQEERDFERAMKNSKSEKEKEEEENERVKKMPHFYHVTMEWVGANPNPELVTEQKVQEYFNYLDPNNRTKSIEGASGFKKLTYKNLYPKIDVAYTFHPSEGLKYNLILHPGADVSQIKMRYNDTKKLYKDNEGNICFTTMAGNITDHAPQTFYEGGQVSIPSSFNLKNNIVTFTLDNYDTTKTAIIDPWINSSLSPSSTVVEISSDAANNVYIYGYTGTAGNSGAPISQYEQKYNAAGVLQWTFNFTSAIKFIENTGDLAVDPAGNSFVTSGFWSIGYFFADCAHAKLNPAGSLMWNFVSPTLYENWRNGFNCDYSQIVQLGVGSGCCNVGQGDIVNTTTGAETGMFSPPNVGDIVTSSYGKNGNLYFLSVIDASPNPHLTCLNPSTGFSTVFNNAYPVNAAFKDGFNTAYGTYGFNGIAAGCSYLYICLGSKLEKRDLNTGALISNVIVPGGVQHANGGLAVDKCGNVYVGTSNSVKVYDANLSLLTSFAAPYPVLDIVLGSGGIFYACGGTVSSGSNAGFVAQFSLSTICTPVTTTFTPNSCGSANIGTATALPVFCAAPYSYVWSTSPVQTTQTATGLAGGTYTVIVTGAGGCNEKDTAIVTIPNGALLTSVATPTNVSCNAGNNGAAVASVSGGTGPFTYSWSPGGQTTSSATNLAAGNYSVTITDATGCSGTQTVSITQPTPIALTVTTTSASCGTTGSGTVTATGGNGGYTYNWNPSAQTTAIANNLNSGNYTVNVTDSKGCVSSATTSVAGNSALQITIGNNGPLCAGANLNLTCNAGASWNWSGPNSFTSSAQNPNITNAQANASGTYSVNVTDANGCSGSGTTTVVVSPLPVPTISSNGPLCANQNLYFTSGGGTTYSWNGPGGFSSSQQNPTINSVNINATGVYTVTVSNAANCQAKITTTVTVNALPIVTTNNATVCADGIINLSATGGVSYSWSGPNAYSSAQQNPVITNATPAMSGSYAVTVTDANGCINANVAQVSVSPSLTVTASNNGPLCAGSILNLLSNTPGTISWSGPNNYSSAQQNPTIQNAQAITSGVYTVTVISVSGCSGTATTTVVINPIPTSISPMAISGCSPLCINFANTSTVSGTCNWNFGDGTISNSCNPYHCFSGQGVFNASFTLTDNNGCTGTSSAIVTVYPTPDADFNADPQPTSILDPVIHFTNNTTGGNGNTWSWNFGDQHSSNQQNPTHTYQEAGHYPTTLIVTSNHGCTDTITKIIVIDEDFEIFVPNAFSPNEDGTNEVFMAKGVGIKDFRMLIFDRWGNEIFTSNDLYTGWDGTVNGDPVQEDVYVWKISVTSTGNAKKELNGHVSLIR